MGEPPGCPAALFIREQQGNEIMEGGGWLWLVVALGTVVLGIAIAVGTQLWRKRRKNRVTEAVREATTRENYRRGG